MTGRQIAVRAAVWVPLLPLLCALQYSGVLSGLWAPKLLLCLVPAVAMFDGPRSGAVLGFAAGFLEDCVPGSVFCFHSLLYMGAGFGMGLWVQTYVRKNLLTYYMYLIGLAVVALLMQLWFGWWRLGGEVAGHMFRARLWKSLLASCLWGLPVYGVTRCLLYRKEA